MKKFLIAPLFLLLLAACTDEQTTSDTTIFLATSEEPKMSSDSLTDMIQPILQPLIEKLAPLKNISGQAHTTLLRTIDGTMESSEVNTSYTLTDIGKYNAPFEGDIHYNVTFEFNEREFEEGYYFPYDYSYKKSSLQPNWSRENLADYTHESEGVQHGFHPSPQRVLAILSELTSIGHISFYDKEQDIVEIGFELNTETHGDVMNELFLHPVEYHNDFFDASRCWHFTEKPSYIYVIVQPNANELISIHYMTDMYCDIIKANMEMTSAWRYDFDKEISPVMVPEDIVIGAKADEIASFEDSE